MQTVYFAYGSNLHLSQMAQRCPESRYLGIGQLHNYKWQINTRGYANIYLSPGSTVQGLCFLLSREDERILDINEGVPTAYRKVNLPVRVFGANVIIAGRRVREVMELLSTSLGNYPPDQLYSHASEELNVLVYVNSEQTNDGAPRTEYVARIRNGIADATRLGIPAGYFEDNAIGPMSR